MATTHYLNMTALASAAAQDFAARAKLAIKQHSAFHVALSGGNTPKYLFDLLVTRADLDWSKIHLYWGDERYVAHTDAQSNYRMVREHLISKVPIPKGNVHPVDTSYEDPHEAARAYQQVLPAQLDLIYLGMGPDGHCASLFPGTKLVRDIVAGEIPSGQLVAATWVEKFNMFRITFLPSVINQSRAVTFLIAGEDKANALAEVLEGKRNPEKYPSQLIEPSGEFQVWVV